MAGAFPRPRAELPSQGIALVSSAVQLLHFADIVLEIAILQIVLRLGADFARILDEIIDVHRVWLITIKDCFQACRAVSP